MAMTEVTVLQPFNPTLSRIPKHADFLALQAAVHEALSHAGHRELRGLELDCDGGAITISGRVSTYYLKQLVQSIALAAPGVRRVHNEVDVC